MKKSSRPKPRVRVAWDEGNLEYLEANKSPKQKITEPKTPYHAPEDSDGAISPLPGEADDEGRTHLDAAVDPEAVKSALSQVASSSNSNGKRWRKSCGWTSSEDDTDEDHSYKDPEHRARFRELRRAHYDEYRRLEMLRSQGSTWPDEEEESIDGRQNVSISNNAGPDQESCLADGVCAIDIKANGTPFQS